MGGGGRGGACNRTKNVFQSMLNQQCLFKASKCHKKKISFQYKLEGAYIGRRWGWGLITRFIFFLLEDGLLLGGGGLIPVNGGGGNNWKFAVTCQRLLHY